MLIKNCNAFKMMLLSFSVTNPYLTVTYPWEYASKEMNREPLC